MKHSIVLAFIGEGTTDDRFMVNIAERLVEQLLLDANKEAIIQWQIITKRGNSFKDKVLDAAKQCKYSTTLIVHADADDNSSANVYETKMEPTLNAISDCNDPICDNITIVIPVSETEAWMLVDKDLLKEEMNTALSNSDLGLTYQINRIENIGDPKAKIESAVRIHHQSITKKRRKYAVTIGDLYEPISRKIGLEKLESLDAFLEFKENLTNALRYKNILD